MKKTAIVLLCVLFCFELFAQNKTYRIAANIKDVPDGTNFYLFKNREGGGRDTVHHMVIDKGKFKVEGGVTDPELHFLFMEGHKEYLPLLIVNGSFAISGENSKWPKIRVKGPKQYREYRRMRQVLDVDLDRNRYLKEKIAAISSDSSKAAEVHDLSLQRDSVLKNYYEHAVPWVVRHYPNSVYSAFLLHKYGMRDNKPLPASEKRKLYDYLTSFVQNSKYGRELLQSIVEQEKRGIIKEGTIIPDFHLIEPRGDTVSIRHLIGKSEYTLIDFWASWCKPCRAQVPHLKQVYAQFKDRGFNIVAISSDKKTEDWRKAMKDDNTPWKHGLQINQNASELFGIKAIPGYILTDRQGKLIAYSVISGISGFGPNIRGEELVKTLTTLFTKSDYDDKKIF